MWESEKLVPSLFPNPAGVVRFARANDVIPCYPHLNFSMAPSRRSRMGIVAEPVLRAKFPVNLIEHGPQLTQGVGKIYGSARAVRNGLQCMFARGIPAAF